MPKIEIEKDQLDAIVAEVGNELVSMLKSEQSALAKAADEDAPAEESEGSSGPASPPPAEDSAPVDEGSAPEAPPAEGSAPPAADAAAAPEGSPEHEAGEIEPAPTVEQLQAEYAKLPPEDLKMHYLAAKSALMAAMGAEQGAPAPGAPPAAPPAPPAPEASAPAAPPMGKKEVKLSDNNGGDEEAPATLNHKPGEAGAKLGKSEDTAKIEKLEKQLSEQTEAVAQLAKAFQVVTTPIRKSVKGVSDLKFVARTEEPKAAPVQNLTKKEVTARLRDKVREGKLSKSDRELVSQYTCGVVDVTKIEHLLADAK